MKEEESKKLNIYEKMGLITEEMAVVEKGLKVQVSQTNSYKAVSERDILDNVKPLEKKYRVYSYPIDRKIVDNDTLVKESEYQGKITKTNTLFMRLEITYRFVNMDNTEDFIDIKTYGDGLDTGDKAPGKAMTYGDKYALMKAYKISTGDDPDKEASPQEGYKTEEKKASPKQLDILEKYFEELEEVEGKEFALDNFLKKNNLAKLEDLSMTKASELISKIMKRGK